VRVGWVLVFVASFAGVGAALAQSPTITGRVTDPQGRGIANATVILVADSPKPDAGNAEGKMAEQKTTGSDGQFSFRGISPGTYTLKLNVDGFEPFSQAVIVSDAPVTADL